MFLPEAWNLLASEAHHQSLHFCTAVFWSSADLVWTYSIKLSCNMTEPYSNNKLSAWSKWVVRNREPYETACTGDYALKLSVHYRWYINVVFKTSVSAQFDVLTFLKQVHESILVKISRLWNCGRVSVWIIWIRRTFLQLLKESVSHNSSGELLQTQLLPKRMVSVQPSLTDIEWWEQAC